MDDVEKALWELKLRAEEIWQANWRRLNNKKDDVSYWPYDWERETRNEDDWFITALPPIGARVEGGDGEDYDTGTVRQHIAGAQVLVAWDSGVTTPAPASILTVIALQ